MLPDVVIGGLWCMIALFLAFLIALPKKGNVEFEGLPQIPEDDEGNLLAETSWLDVYPLRSYSRFLLDNGMMVLYRTVDGEKVRVENYRTIPEWKLEEILDSVYAGS